MVNKLGMSKPVPAKPEPAPKPKATPARKDYAAHSSVRNFVIETERAALNKFGLGRPERLLELSGLMLELGEKLAERAGRTAAKKVRRKEAVVARQAAARKSQARAASIRKQRKARVEELRKLLGK